MGVLTCVCSCVRACGGVCMCVCMCLFGSVGVGVGCVRRESVFVGQVYVGVCE